MALLENNEYKLTVETNNGGYYTYEFKTEYEPFYSSVGQVAGPPLTGFLDEINREDIAYQIYVNSKIAAKKSTDNEDIDLEGEVQEIINEYVTYKTQYDIFFNNYLQIVKNNKDIDLADFSVGEIDVDSFKDILEMLKDKYKKIEEEVVGKRGASPMSVLKADGDYPFEYRREFS